MPVFWTTGRPGAGPALAGPVPAAACLLAGPLLTGCAPATEGSPPSSPPGLVPPALSAVDQADLDRRLLLAAKANDPALVQELIDAGGNVNATDALQDSAFLYAGAEGFNEVLQLTLAAGADPGIRDAEGNTALQNAERLGFTAIAELLRAFS